MDFFEKAINTILEFFGRNVEAWIAGLSFGFLILFILVMILFGKNGRLKKKVKKLRESVIDTKIAVYNADGDISCKNCLNYRDENSKQEPNQCCCDKCPVKEEAEMLEPTVTPAQVVDEPKEEVVNEKVETKEKTEEEKEVKEERVIIEEKKETKPTSKRQKTGMYKYSLVMLNEIAIALSIEGGKTKAEVITKIKYALNKKMVTKAELIDALGVVGVYGVENKKKDDLIKILKKTLNKR